MFYILINSEHISLWTWWKNARLVFISAKYFFFCFYTIFRKINIFNLIQQIQLSCSFIGIIFT